MDINSKPVEDWTPAKLARWMAERDGWKRVESLAESFGWDEPSTNNGLSLGWGCPPNKNWKQKIVRTPDYYLSLDAAVGWLDRMGLEWRRTFDVEEGKFAMEAYDVFVWRAEYETPDIPTAHALCIAGVKAQMAKEATL